MLKKIIKAFLILIIVVDLFSMGVLYYLISASKKAADPSDTSKVEVQIESGWSAAEISKELKVRGIIKNELYFIFYVVWNKEENMLKAGDYVLSPSMTAEELVGELKIGKIKEISVTIPEGLTTSQIEKVLREANINIKENELVEAINIPVSLASRLFNFTFMLDLPSSVTLDGFLFPDTYNFEDNPQLHAIIEKMLSNFDEKLTDPMKVKFKADLRTLYEVVIMASLLEKEVQTYEDMQIVAGILWKRLDIGMPLQVDATLLYITGKKGSELTSMDKLIDSSHNTYLYRGLTPTPINNPGLNSIKAAIYPTKTDYLYYLSTPNGETIFSKTLEEHNENKRKYLM